MDTGGIRMIAYACSYVPVEIIMTSGLVPRRMIPEGRPSDAESHVHANTCCYVKSLLASALDGGGSPFDGIIFANSCDGMRRLNDLWARYVQGPPALFIDIPKKKDQDSIAFFSSELRRLADNLETVFLGSQVTIEGLNIAIKRCNEIRQLMGEVFRRQETRGSKVFELCLEGSQSETVDFTDKIKQFLLAAGEDKPGKTGKRIVLTGNAMHRSDLITLIEDAGAQVAALDTCIGARHFETLVEEDTADPILALARRYLLRPSCARMLGFEEQFQYLQKVYEKAGAQGIICSAVKYCDLLIYNVPLMQARFRDLEIPFLFLENDYTWTDLGQMRTRVDAFLEMLGEGKNV